MLETVVLPLTSAQRILTAYLRDVSHWQLYGDGALIFIMTQTEPTILARYNKQLRGYVFARYQL